MIQKKYIIRRMEHQIQYFRKTYLDHVVVLLKSNTETIKAKENGIITFGYKENREIQNIWK